MNTSGKNFIGCRVRLRPSSEFYEQKESWGNEYGFIEKKKEFDRERKEYWYQVKSGHYVNSYHISDLILSFKHYSHACS